MNKDVMEKMTKAELICWIKENLFLREKPKWSWVLDKRHKEAVKKEEEMREEEIQIFTVDYREYNKLVDQLKDAKNQQQKLSILNKFEEFHAAVARKNLVRKKIDKQYQKANNLFKQLQKAWEDERNERSKTNK